jgi:hypothetical protein
VDVVFSGHAHLYDRFAVPHEGHTTHYIVTGGGGGPLYKGGQRNDVPGSQFTVARSYGYHVVRVVVDGKELEVSCVKIGGDATNPSSDVFEQFRIAR